MAIAASVVAKRDELVPSARLLGENLSGLVSVSGWALAAGFCPPAASAQWR